jgi:hypothetical protein
MTNSKNYKQKWLEAIDAHRTEPVAHADTVRLRSQTVSTTNSDAALVLRQIGSNIGNVAVAAQSLVSEMDDHRDIAGLAFSEIGGEIDTKLTRMPAGIALRRIRDLFQIAEARIAMLHIQADDLYRANDMLRTALERSEATSKTVQRALIETAWVGPQPSATDIEDFNATSAGEYRRDGLHYSLDADDFIMTKLFANTSLRTVANTNLGLTADDDDDNDDDTSDSETDEATVARMQTPATVNRYAQVVPTSIYAHTKVDI